ncbi:polyphosphate kinase 2, partial [bacterium]|nr:polyphosphate kinase 2 [bacterium]
MGHKENKKSKHNSKSKETALPNGSKPLSAAEMGGLDGRELGSAALADRKGDGLQRPSYNGERLKKKIYESELEQLQTQLVKMQYWIKEKGFRMIILF